MDFRDHYNALTYEALNTVDYFKVLIFILRIRYSRFTFACHPRIMSAINLDPKEAFLKLSPIRQGMLVCFALLSLVAFRNQLISLKNTLSGIEQAEKDLTLYKKIAVFKVHPQAISNSLFDKDEILTHVSQLCAEKQISIVQVAKSIPDHCPWAELKIAVSGNFVDVLTLLNDIDLHDRVPVCTHIKMEESKDKLKAHEVACTLFFKIDS
jgi:hypothetical protein